MRLKTISTPMRSRLTFYLAILVAIVSSNARAQVFEFPPIARLYVTEGIYYTDGEPHGGIDFRAPLGTPVFAIADGWAIASLHEDYFTSPNGSPKKNYGRFVLVVHDNGTSAIYAHLAGTEYIRFHPFTRPGFTSNRNYSSDWTRVRQGQAIGVSGSSGTRTPHLHFEVARNSLGTYSGHFADRVEKYDYVDPYDIFGFRYAYPPRGSGYTRCGSRSVWSASTNMCVERPALLDQGAYYFGGAGGPAVCAPTDYEQIVTQTFTVGETGILYRVSLGLERYEAGVPSPFTVSIFPYFGGVPNLSTYPLFARTYAASNVPVLNSIGELLIVNLLTNFDVGYIPVRAGERYVIAVSRPFGSCQPNDWILWNGAPSYSRGETWIKNQNQGWLQQGDRAFQTFVIK